MLTLLAVLLLGYVPGALVFRLPVGSRPFRAALPIEERAFWSIAISLALTTAIGLVLATFGWYDFRRLVAADASVAAVALLILVVRRSLRLAPGATWPTLTIVLPLLLLGVGLWVNFRVPPAEYIVGGRDPGIYMNEGIRIAQRGGIKIADDVVSAVPPGYRDLFFPRTTQHGYYSNRFMGFFLLDPRRGTVVGQFPDAFPLWIAIGYGLNGLNGARAVPSVCGILGLLAVYFAGSRLVGRGAAFAGALLLAVNVVQVWYSRYPAAEILLQPIVFTALLAYLRAVHDGDDFFAPLAALLLVLGAFDHLTGAMVVAIVAGAALIGQIAFRRRVPLWFWLPLVVGTLAAGVYMWRDIPPYFDVPLGFVQNLTTLQLIAGGGGLAAGLAALVTARRLAPDTRVRLMAWSLIAIVFLLAAYALLLRRPGPSLAVHDADSLRTFTAFYLSPYGLVAALIGFALVAGAFADTSAFVLLVAGFAVIFFYKIRIVPEHFWAARRFLAVVLPSALLLAGAAAFDLRQLPIAAPFAWLTGPSARRTRAVLGLALVVVLGYRFATATRPILHHVEYAGLIPHIEQLSSTFGDDDLVLVESRGASDAHVLALPLSYIYARNVLVFAAPDPPKGEFREFLLWALRRYRRVFFVGGAGGGTELLSRSMTVNAIRGERFQVPEYESAVNSYPSGVRQKEFDLSVYEFLPVAQDEKVVSLDVGAADDLYVRRFYAKEKSPAGFTFRWTRDQSFVSLVGLRPEHRTITLWMGTGGRPRGAPDAGVEVFLEDRPIGTASIGSGLEAFRFDIPADLADRLGQGAAAARLQIDTATWNPARVIGGGDTRDLGVMLDRIEVR